MVTTGEPSRERGQRNRETDRDTYRERDPETERQKI